MGGAYPCAIHESELDAYARMMGYADDAETIEEFRLYMKAQDREWLAYYAERNTRSP